MKTILTKTTTQLYSSNPWHLKKIVEVKLFGIVIYRIRIESIQNHWPE